jgi:hypothetical protein
MGGTSIFLLYFSNCDDDGEVGGMNDFGRGNRSTRRKPTPTQNDKQIYLLPQILCEQSAYSNKAINIKLLGTSLLLNLTNM